MPFKSRMSVVVVLVCAWATALQADTVTMYPGIVDFGSQSPGNVSYNSAFLQNGSHKPLNISNYRITGDFTIQGTTCAAVLPAEHGCGFTIVFAPTASGTRTGTLSVFDDAGDGTQKVKLTGVGVGPDLVSIMVSPASAWVQPGQQKAFQAWGNYSNGATAPAIATVNSLGVVSTYARGAASISATLQGISGSAALTVTPQVLCVPGGGVNNLPAIVDLTSKSIVGFLQSGGNAQYMAVTPGGSRAYITEPFDQSVAVIDFASDTRVATIPMPGIPFHVVLQNDGSRAYVGVLNTVQVIDTGTNTVISQIALPATSYSLAVSRTLPRLYVGTPGSIFVIDTTTDSIVSSIPVGNLIAVAIVPSPDGSRLYILGRDDANAIAGYLITADLSLGQVTGSIPLGIYPFDLAVTPDGARIYASFQGPINAFTGTLIVVDLASSSIIGTVPLPGYAGRVAIGPGGSEVYVAVNEPLANVVDTISVTTLTITARITGFWGGAHDLVFLP